MHQIISSAEQRTQDAGTLTDTKRTNAKNTCQLDLGPIEAQSDAIILTTANVGRKSIHQIK